MYADYHTHSTYSPDGTAPVDLMCQAAACANVGEICFTEHIDYQPTPSKFNRTPDFLNWYKDIAAAREKYPRLIVRSGIEMGYDAPSYEATKAAMAGQPLDYALLSHHLIRGVDPYDAKVYFFGRSKEDGYREYAEAIAASMKIIPPGDYDGLAHLGYCAKFSRYALESKPFLYRHAPDAIDEILRTLAQNGKQLEINTSFYRTSITSLPGADILKRYKELGGEFVCLSSDAHRPEHVGIAFEKARAVAIGCGFRYRLSFERRKGTAQSL